MSPTPKRLLYLVWIGAVIIFIALLFLPVSNRLTRLGSLALLAIIWSGLIGLSWPRKTIRFFLPGLTLLSAIFLTLPARPLPDPAVLRDDYVAALQHYEGVPYFWGGENGRGIDCSGLIRRGFIDTLAKRGLLTGEPGLVRRALSLWWHDSTAEALGEAHEGITIAVLKTPSVNQLDPAKLLPGDLAVTTSGVHIMAYLGGSRWIEADPGVGKVISATAPVRDNAWFDSSMKIVRWTLLQP